MATQPFKRNDIKEEKMLAAFSESLDPILAERDALYSGAYTCFLLGDVLFTLGADPMAGAITQETFRDSFPQIHSLFTRPGTFEFYMEVFKAIWGDDVGVEFTVPAPGKLLININSLDIVATDWLAREIVDDAYVLVEIVDHEDENILLQDAIGVKTEEEAIALVHELYPAGLWVQTTLQVGS